HVIVRIPIEADPKGRLPATAVTGGATGEDPWRGKCGPKGCRCQVRAVEVDERVACGKFERAPARAPQRHRRFRNDAGVSPAGRVVVSCAANAVARLDIAAIEI